MKIMVVGGAGYIGAHVVNLLEERGDTVVVVDDLSTGSASRVGSASLVEMDVADASQLGRLTAAMRDIDAVIHFAARKQVGESVAKPAWYYQQNIGGLALVLQAMADAGVDRIIFSSSAAVYGIPDVGLVNEDTLARPINPYGQTKLFGEQMLAACERAYGFKWIGLRYFNVAGAGSAELGDPAILNLIPMVFERLDMGENPLIFGGDYPTEDGTCIRDYIHVTDLAAAHLEALDYLQRCESAGNAEEGYYRVFNIGTGKGYSVRNVIDEIAAATGRDFTPEVVARRAGDPPQLVADASRAREVMGFTPRYNLSDIVSSAWQAWQQHPGQR